MENAIPTPACLPPFYPIPVEPYPCLLACFLNIFSCGTLPLPACLYFTILLQSPVPACQVHSTQILWSPTPACLPPFFWTLFLWNPNPTCLPPVFSLCLPASMLFYSCGALPLPASFLINFWRTSCLPTFYSIHIQPYLCVPLFIPLSSCEALPLPAFLHSTLFL